MGTSSRRKGLPLQGHIPGETTSFVQKDDVARDPGAEAWKPGLSTVGSVLDNLWHPLPTTPPCADR